MPRSWERPQRPPASPPDRSQTVTVGLMRRVQRRRAGRAAAVRVPGATGHPVVWFVNQYAGSRRHGMEFRHYELGRELATRGWTVVVISGSFSHLYTSQPGTRATYAIRDVDGLTYCWIKVPAYRRAASVARVVNMMVFALRLCRLPTARLPAPDAIVVSSPSLFPFLPAERWARRFSARLVLEVRDIWPLTLQELAGMGSLHPLVLVLRWFERRSYRRADAVVSVLPAASTHFEAHGVPTDRIAIIPNGVAPDVIGAEPGPLPAALDEGVGRWPFTVGFVGTLGAANALETLVGAARELAGEDIGFVIAGHGPDGNRLRELAADLPNVVFTGAIAKSAVPAALASFDVCYVGYHRSPLYRFGISPNKVFDYMAAGRPVILAASAANDPVAEGRCGLTVEPDDPEAVARAILELRAMASADRERMGANGRAHVRRVHAYDRLAGAYEAVLRRQGR